MLRIIIPLFVLMGHLPGIAFAERACDGGAALDEYLDGGLEGPKASAIAEFWLKEGAPIDISSTDAEVLRKAITSVESSRLSAQETAEAIAGEWTDWRSKLMTREEFIDGFLQEVTRRKTTLSEHRSILQAAQAMLNRLDDLSGAAGQRPYPEDPYLMWRWDLSVRTTGAMDEVMAVYSLPDGNRYWEDYMTYRKWAIACAIDDMAGQSPLVAMMDASLFKRPEIVLELVAGRKIPIDFPTMAYFSGFFEGYTPLCSWNGSSASLASVARFQVATTNSALSQMLDLDSVVADTMVVIENAGHGQADAAALLENYGCDSEIAGAFVEGLARAVEVDASPSSSSLFVQSCSQQGLSFKQCGCLAELGRGVAPGIANSAYDSRTTIRWIIERNPIVGMEIPLLCGIVEY